MRLSMRARSSGGTLRHSANAFLAAATAASTSAAELSATLTRFLADPTGAAAYASTSQYAAVPAYAATTMTPVPGDPSATSMTVLMAQPPLPPDPPERSGSGPWGWVAGILGLLVILASGVLLFLLGVPVLITVVRRYGYYDPFGYQDAVLGMLLVLACVIAVQLSGLKPPPPPPRD